MQRKTVDSRRRAPNNGYHLSVVIKIMRDKNRFGF